jgi:MoxR-like ATPase
MDPLDPTLPPDDDAGAPPPPAAGDLSAASGLANRIRDEVSRVVVGQDDAITHVVAALIAGGHVLLEGVPGLGKTLLVLALARTFGGEFARVQFTPDLMPSDVTGHAMLDGSTGEFTIRKGPAFTNLLLTDEINRAPAKTQAALLEVMQEEQITIEGESFRLAPPFMVLATQNPIEQEGTYPLPEAQLDRFLLKVRIDYPDEAQEEAIVRAVTLGSIGQKLDVSTVRTVASPDEVTALQQAAASVGVDERITGYAVRIVRATRQWSGISVGAGPRGAIALVRVARALALLAGRDFVLPDDVRDVAYPVLRHRVVLSPEVQIEGLSADEVLAALLAKVPAPRS